jgi:hypothetical protein
MSEDNINKKVRESIDPVLNYALQHINSDEHIPLSESMDDFSWRELLFIIRHLKSDCINYSNAIKSVRALARSSKDKITQFNSQSIESSLKKSAREAHIVHCLFRGTPLSKIESPAKNNMVNIDDIKLYIEAIYTQCIIAHEKYMGSVEEVYNVKNPTEYKEIEEIEESMYELQNLEEETSIA